MFNQKGKKDRIIKLNGSLFIDMNVTSLALILLMFILVGIHPTNIKAANNNQNEPSVKLSFTPSSIKMIAGQKAKVKINIERINYDDPVQIQTGEMPDGFEVQFEENPVEGDTATAWIYSPANALGCDNSIEFSSEAESTTEPKAKLEIMINCGIEWYKQFGSFNADVIRNHELHRITGLTVDKDGNIYFAGNTTWNVVTNANPSIGDLDIWLAKHDKFGTQQWIQQYGTNQKDQVLEVEVNDDSEVVMAGYTFGNFYASSGNSTAPWKGIWVGKADRTGFDWVDRAISTYTSDNSGMTLNISSLRVNLFASQRNKFQFQTYNVLRYILYGMNGYDLRKEPYNYSWESACREELINVRYIDVVKSSEYWKDDYALVGSIESYNGQKVEYVQLCDYYNRVWRFIGNPVGTEDRIATRVVLDTAKNLYVSGIEGEKSWVAKYDSNGNRNWHKYLENDGEVRINAIELNKDGDVIVAGKTNSVLGERNGGGTDAWVSRYSSIDGEQIWIEQFPVNNDDSIESIAFDESNGIYLGGSGTYWTDNLYNSTDALLLKYYDPVANYSLLPKITSFSPSSAYPGQEITINGKHFFNLRAVHFNGEPARIKSYTSGAINVVVPLTVTEGKVTVTTDCLTVSSPTNFTIQNP